MSSTKLTSCAELKACLDGAIASGTLPAFNSTQHTEADSGGSDSAGLAVYFALTYFLFYVCGWTSTKIPYDALGMELTPYYDEKTKLFGAKTAFQFGGYLLQVPRACTLKTVLACRPYVPC